MTERATLAVDPSNLDARAGWDGAEGEYWTEHEDDFDRSVARYDTPLLEAAGIGLRESVLDIGCGTGHVTRLAARTAASGRALGVDLSGSMIRRARLRAQEQALDNVTFEQADAQVHPFDPGSFDVAVSRTGAMFFGDPVAAFANIGAALAPGGRLALLTWQRMEDNEWLTEFLRAVTGRAPAAPPPEAPGPFALADPGRVDSILSRAGFTGIACRPVREPMFFGVDGQAAYRFVGGLGPIRSLLGTLDPAAREGARAALRRTIRAHTTVDGVLFASAAWIVTARR